MRLLQISAPSWLNRFWIQDTELKALGATFFSLFAPSTAEADTDWSKLRDVWEYSHVARIPTVKAAL